MTYKLIVFAPHAKGRIKGRGTTRSDVRWLLAHGISFAAAQRDGADLRLGKRGYLGRDEAAIIYTENAQQILIITIMWVEGGSIR